MRSGTPRRPPRSSTHRSQEIFGSCPVQRTGWIRCTARSARPRRSPPWVLRDVSAECRSALPVAGSSYRRLPPDGTPIVAGGGPVPDGLRAPDRADNASPWPPGPPDGPHARLVRQHRPRGQTVDHRSLTSPLLEGVRPSCPAPVGSSELESPADLREPTTRIRPDASSDKDKDPARPARDRAHAATACDSAFVSP